MVLFKATPTERAIIYIRTSSYYHTGIAKGSWFFSMLYVILSWTGCPYWSFCLNFLLRFTKFLLFSNAVMNKWQVENKVCGSIRLCLFIAGNPYSFSEKLNFHNENDRVALLSFVFLFSLTHSTLYQNTNYTQTDSNFYSIGFIS